jgi:hypothetical protein
MRLKYLGSSSAIKLPINKPGEPCPCPNCSDEEGCNQCFLVYTKLPSSGSIVIDLNDEVYPYARSFALYEVRSISGTPLFVETTDHATVPLPAIYHPHFG